MVYPSPSPERQKYISALHNKLTISSQSHSAFGFGSDKLYLFCTSGGGIIEFRLAASYPDRIAHMIAHEAGPVGLPKDSEKYIDLFHQVYSLYLTQGKKEAYKVFRCFMSTGYEDAETTLPRLAGAAEGDDERF
jgi:pimeloyl-ACP methyl ester carboxylesterase